MILSCDVAGELSTSALNLSMLAKAASLPGSKDSSVSAVCGPYLGGITSSHPAPVNSFTAAWPTSSNVRAVIRTFQDMRRSVSSPSDPASASRQAALQRFNDITLQQFNDLTASATHDILRLSLLKGAHVGHGHLHQARARPLCGPGDVRRDQTILHAQERIISRWRLLRQHVQTRSGNSIRVEGFGKGCLIDQQSPAGVEQECRRLHPCQALRVDELPGLRGQWAMQTDDVAATEKRFQIQKLDVGRRLRRDGSAMRHYFHSQCRAQIAHRPADAPKADNPHGQSIQFDQRIVPVTEVRAARPSPVADRL